MEMRKKRMMEREIKGEKKEEGRGRFREKKEVN